MTHTAISPETEGTARMVANKAFVMGHPIAQSRSPLMHGYWLEQMGIDGSYERLDIPPEGLAGFFAAYRDVGWIGGNVTVPHKSAVIPFLDRIDDDRRARRASRHRCAEERRAAAGQERQSEHEHAVGDGHELLRPECNPGVPAPATRMGPWVSRW